MKLKLIIFTLIILVGITAALLSLRDSDDSELNNSSNMIVGENAIYVSDQKPLDFLNVSFVRFEKPGFVAVHENINDKPGNILGQSLLLSAGETKNFSFMVSRKLVDEETVYAMLHLDDGDGIFDPKKDKPAIDSISGNPIMMIVVVGDDASPPDDVLDLLPNSLPTANSEF